MQWDFEAFEKDFHLELDQALHDAISQAACASAAIDGITPEDAVKDIRTMVGRWARGVAAYPPTPRLSECERGKSREPVDYDEVAAGD